jgi:acetaldehyde dehydrogenase/alcohol dehydrogenase
MNGSLAQQIMARAVAAAAAFRKLDQARTDRIVRSIYLATLEARVRLARLAHEETGMGVWQHKVIKNVIAAQLVYEDIKEQKTVGVISVDTRNGVTEIAQSLGPILGFVPVTNPTATTIFKCLIAMKTRNPLIISPPHAAKGCVGAAAQLCYEAAIGAGAPEQCIQWLDKPADTLIEELLGQRRLALVLATGTHKLVRKAATSGIPTIGVGPGNVPVYIGSTADIPYAVRCILDSKTFDHGTVCASEQALVVKEEIAARVIAELERQGAHFLSPTSIDAVGRVAWDSQRGLMTPMVVGQSVQRIAEMAGIAVPSDARLLVARLEGVGRDHPLSAEILAPILAFYVEPDFETSIARCNEITHYGGLGHTAVIYSNTDERIEYFSTSVDAARILVNIPSTYGALGGMVSTLSPSFTLGCGSGAHNSTTDNITARHLLNIHRITRRRPNPLWERLEHGMYLDETLSAERLEWEFHKDF